MDKKVPELLDLTRKLLDQSIEIVNNSLPSSESGPVEEVRYSIFLRVQTKEALKFGYGAYHSCDNGHGHRGIGAARSIYEILLDIKYINQDKAHIVNQLLTFLCPENKNVGECTHPYYTNLMKKVHFLILLLPFVTTVFLSTKGLTQDYVHHITLRGNEWLGKNVSFSPDGKTLASVEGLDGLDKTIRLWDVETGTYLRSLGRFSGSVLSASFSPDGKTLAGASGEILLFNTATGKIKKEVSEHISNWVFGGATCILFSPDGRMLAVGSVYGKIYLFETAADAHKQMLTGHTSFVDSLLFSPDGNILASESLDKTIRLWRVSTPQPTADQVYNNTIRAVIWIVNPGVGEGSGVLIDKQFKLAVTNAHVTSEQNTIDVYFPAPDEKGKLVKHRNFYLTNRGVLKRLGYYTKGRVVARNEETDLAIIKLDGLPETAREVDWNFAAPTTNAGDLVYILGNPVGQDLWRWTLGEFLNEHGDFLHIQSDVFGGNSGGPVLNKQGILLGIAARSDRHMNALAIPVRDINQLLSESQLKHSRSRR